MSDHYVELCYSKDGGHTWSNWQRRSIGEVGQYQDRLRVRWQALGTSRQWVFKVRVSSPRGRDLLGAVVNTEVLDG
ncbi:MAG TPA: hypothetical protein VFH85_07770 [Gammaproteobacteria bacterium]|nr:hypothetical protein [Gammaproteobacteria bacterium]